MIRRLRALRVLHPFPSFLNSVLVALIAARAGGDGWTVALLAGAMLGMQFSIGATNDVADRELDAAAKRWKPIPAGVLSTRAASATAAVAAATGLGLALLVGPVTAVLWAAMLGSGLAYNFWLKPTAWAWACFSAAFAVLPVYAWRGATGAMPPMWEFVVVAALLAGPALQLANSIIDLDTDAAAGLRTPAVLLGPARALTVMAALLVAVHALAWLTLATVAGDGTRALLGVASVAAASSAWLSSGAPPGRRLGWSGQALSVSLVAVAWLTSVG